MPVASVDLGAQPVHRAAWPRVLARPCPIARPRTRHPGLEDPEHHADAHPGPGADDADADADGGEARQAQRESH
jgi:hypothetical protein